MDDFEIDREQITVVRLLGSGNFGQVSKAIYGASRLDVAVKSLKGAFSFYFYFYSQCLIIYYGLTRIIGSIFIQLFGCLKSIRKQKIIEQAMQYFCNKVIAKTILCF